MAGEGAPAQKLLTPAQILAMLLTVGGPGSGLDADTVDGIHAAGFVQLAGTQTISGAKTISAQLTSTVATGTAPFVVASTTQVANLNAALLGGNAASAFVLQSIATAKGDLLAATGSGVIARLAVGTNTWVLTADSTQASGMKWAAPASTFDPTQPGPIGGTTPSSGAFTTLTASSTLGVTGLATLTGGLTTPAVITSTIATGTAPFTVASTTVVANLNASQLGGNAAAAFAKVANNLSDLASASTARTNLGLGSIATQAATSVAITGGAIDGTAIGATTASTGKFTTLTNTGLTATRVTFAGTGGLLGDSANLTYGSGTFTIADTTATSNATTGALVVGGGIGVGGSIFIAGNASFCAPGEQVNLSSRPSTITMPARATTTGSYFPQVANYSMPASVAAGVTDSGYRIGFYAEVLRNYRAGGGTADSSGTLASIFGALIKAGHYNTDAVVPVTGTIYAMEVELLLGTGTVTTAAALHIDPNNLTGATVTTKYGMKIESCSGATSNFAIQTGAGLVSFGDTTDSTSISTGSVQVAGGIGVAKRLTLDGSTGKTIRIANSSANAAVATTLGSVGPTGSTAGNPQGWMRIDINGTDRFIPFW